MTEPVGSLPLWIDHLRQSLADSAAFRTWVGAANQAEALEHIHWDALPPPTDDAEEYTAAALAAYRPYALLGLDEEQGYQRTRVSQRGFETACRLILMLIQADPGSEDRTDDDIAWQNTIEAITADIEARVNTAGYLCFDRWKIDEGPGRRHPDYDPACGAEQGVIIAFEGRGA